MDKRRNSQPDPRRRRTVPTGGRPAVRSGSGGRSAASPGRPAGKRSAAPPSSRGQKGPARVQRGYAPGHVRDPRAERIQEIQQRRKKKRKRNYTLYYILLFFFLTVAGIVLSLTVFFNIRNIEVTGSAIYGVEDVEPLLGVQKGDNLLRISDDPDVNDVLKFLREREIVHFQRFGEAVQLLREKLDQKNVYFMNPALDM